MNFGFGTGNAGGGAGGGGGGGGIGGGFNNFGFGTGNNTGGVNAFAGVGGSNTGFNTTVGGTDTNLAFNFGGGGQQQGGGGGAFNFGSWPAGNNNNNNANNNSATNIWGGVMQVAPQQAANAFDRRDQMTPAQHVAWVHQMQQEGQKMLQYLDQVRQAQEKRFQDTLKAMDDINKALSNLQNKFEVEVVQKLPAGKLAHLNLAHRLVVVMKQIELLRLRNRSTSSIEEEVWRSKLQSMKRELDRPDQFSGRLKELTSKVKLQDAAFGAAVLETVDPDQLEALGSYLTEQSEGLEKLVNVLNKDIKDLSIMNFPH